MITVENYFVFIENLSAVFVIGMMLLLKHSCMCFYLLLFTYPSPGVTN